MNESAESRYPSSTDQADLFRKRARWRVRHSTVSTILDGVLWIGVGPHRYDWESNRPALTSHSGGLERPCRLSTLGVVIDENLEGRLPVRLVGPDGIGRHRPGPGSSTRKLTSPRIPRNNEGLDREPKEAGSSRIGSSPIGSRTTTRFWYRNDLAGGAKEFVLVVPEAGTREPAFDHVRLASSLSKAEGSDSWRIGSRLATSSLSTTPRRSCSGQRRHLEVLAGFLRMLEDRPRPAQGEPSWS